ncbi:MAG: S-adenosylmethionine decarboxylase [Nitrosomonadales bacterium]|nr:S-adenosylmethionine decarboxylase [Nitrosomonadales bacterium]MBT5150079.1 S-adenosylmethionine decarboxylase [Nitrosomonadales bacterium]MBT6015385.1 S-adenosylmethionine decarboxylase [Nitrosomonadales bacterium]MBT6251278.1 S-adenosylmethionine decarboxylase [Nitrosomonadales bacterium]MBT6602675.1 S-adenosylmethionine decarboxylase [Nitrosomonadales bacterium]
MEYWGYHLILDCKGGDLDKVRSSDNINQFTKTLVAKINMVAFGEPKIAHFAANNPNAAGFSLVQLIETSSITGHFVDLNGDSYIDIFSCKSFDIETVKDVVNQFFSPKQIKVTYLTRQA